MDRPPHRRRERDGSKGAFLLRGAAAGFAVVLVSLLASLADLLADIVGLGGVEAGLRLCGHGAGIVAQAHEQREMIGADVVHHRDVKEAERALEEHVIQRPAQQGPVGVEGGVRAAADAGVEQAADVLEQAGGA